MRDRADEFVGPGRKGAGPSCEGKEDGGWRVVRTVRGQLVGFGHRGAGRGPTEVSLLSPFSREVFEQLDEVVGR